MQHQQWWLPTAVREYAGRLWMPVSI